MYINKLTITSIFEKNKNLLQAINPEKERAIGLIKDRLASGDEIYAGEGLPSFMKNLIPQNKLAKYNITIEPPVENHKNPIWNLIEELSKRVGPFLNK